MARILLHNAFVFVLIFREITKLRVYGVNSAMCEPVTSLINHHRAHFSIAYDTQYTKQHQKQLLWIKLWK